MLTKYRNPFMMHQSTILTKRYLQVPWIFSWAAFWSLHPHFVKESKVNQLEISIVQQTHLCPLNIYKLGTRQILGAEIDSPIGRSKRWRKTVSCSSLTYSCSSERISRHNIHRCSVNLIEKRGQCDSICHIERERIVLINQWEVKVFSCND